MNSMTVTISDVRLSYTNLFEAKPPFNNPAGELKFSTTVLVSKKNQAAKAAIDAAINAAMEAGPSKCWNNVRPPQVAICVHDGDGVRPSDGMPFGPECKGCWVFTASCKADRPPFVVDANVQPILQRSEIYSGVYGNINVTFFPYSNSGKKGIGCGLNGFQKTRDGEPLGSTVTPQEAFGVVSQATAGYGAAIPQAAPASPATPVGYTPVAPAYPQSPAGYPASSGYAAPAIDPITGQPINPDAPIMGV